MIFVEDLYDYYDFVAEPVRNAIRIAPAAIRKGMRPKATRDVRH